MIYFPFLSRQPAAEKNIIELHNTAVRSQNLLRSHSTGTAVVLTEIKNNDNNNKNDG